MGAEVRAIYASNDIRQGEAPSLGKWLCDRKLTPAIDIKVVVTGAGAFKRLSRQVKR